MLRGLAGRDLYLDIRQALHLAAIDADEMRMLGGGVVVAAAQFESPGVVARVEPIQQTGVGQFDQAAIQRGFVVAFGN